MSELSPRELLFIEIAHTAFKAITFGTFAAFAIAPFIEHGRLVRLIIGG